MLCSSKCNVPELWHADSFCQTEAQKLVSQPVPMKEEKEDVWVVEHASDQEGTATVNVQSAFG